MPRELMPLLEVAKGAVLVCPECDLTTTSVRHREGDPCPACTRAVEGGVDE